MDLANSALTGESRYEKDEKPVECRRFSMTFVAVDRTSGDRREKVNIETHQRPLQKPRRWFRFLQPRNNDEVIDEMDTYIRRKLHTTCKVSHPGIREVKEVFISQDGRLNIVMEYSDKTLKDYITTTRPYLKEWLVRHYFRTIVLTAEFCHQKENGYAIRKIEPCNIMMIDKDDDVCMSDMGFGRGFDEEQPPTIFGPEDFLAPEILESTIGHGKKDLEKLDSWLLGATLYFMLKKVAPAVGTFKRKKRQDPMFDHLKVREGGDNLTDDCVNLLTKLLDPKPEKRLSIREIREHPWFRCGEMEEKHKEMAEATWSSISSGEQNLAQNESGQSWERIEEILREWRSRDLK